MGKEKKEKKDKSLNESQIAEENGEEMSYEDRLEFVSVIAKPMATKKLAKKVETDPKKTGQDQKLTIDKKSTIFELSLRNLVKRATSWVHHFDQVSC